MIKGKLISVCWALDSSIFALSAASRRTLSRHRVFREIDRVILFELVDQVLDHPLVEIVPAQMRVAVGGFHFDDVLTDFEDRDVEGPTPEVVDGDLLVVLLVEPIGQCRRGGLVDDAFHFEPRDRAGVLGRLALRVVEVGGDGDDRCAHALTQIGLGGGLEFLQRHGRNLGRRHRLAIDLDRGAPLTALDDLVGHETNFLGNLADAAPHEALDGINGALGVVHGLSFGGRTDKAFPFVGERNHRRCRPPALFVRDDGRLSALHHRHDGVCGSEVNANDFSRIGHFRCSFRCVGQRRAGLAAKN